MSYAARLGLFLFGKKTNSTKGNKIILYLKDEFATSMAAKIFTVPLIFLHFKQISLISPFSNIAVSWLIAPLMIFGQLTAFLGKMHIVLGIIPAYICYGILSFTVWVIETFSQIPFCRYPTLTAKEIKKISQITVEQKTKINMDESPINIKNITLVLLFGLFIMLSIFALSFLDPRTKIVFCDVGKGDGAYIRIHNKIDVVIDAGPDTKILRCLGKYMPCYDKEIEIAIISHPQKDHYYGYIPTLNYYKIDNMFMNNLDYKGPDYAKLKSLLVSKHVKIHNPYAGMSISIAGDFIRFVWPTQTYFDDNSFTQENSSYRQTLVDLNNFSITCFFVEKFTKVLFTGDASPEMLHLLTEQSNVKTTILKVPHHGSKNSLTQEFLELADPQLSVIGVGKHNVYHHPSKSALDLFKSLNKKYVRTDQNGDVAIRI